MQPQNFPEKAVWYGIVATYPVYLIGGLYILAPALGWRLWRQDENTPAHERIVIPLGVWVWVAAMVVMLLTLLVAHADFHLGAAKTLKSSIGWAKGWALLAVFPLLGCLPIRAELVYRASAVVCKHTLLILPVLLLGPALHLPQNLYTSPLQAVGGPGPEFFTVTLYSIDPDGATRWRLFTPWGPALGFIANIYFIFALQQRGTRWFWYGVAGAVAMCLGPSRAWRWCPRLGGVPHLEPEPLGPASGVVSVRLGLQYRRHGGAGADPVAGRCGG